MIRVRSLLFAALFTFLFSPQADAASTAETVSRTLLVKYRPEASRESSLQEIESELNSLGLEVVSVLKQIRWIEARTAGETQVSEDIFQKVWSIPGVERVERDQVMKVIAEPNDPMWSQQGGMQRLNVTAAWDRTTGSPDVVVAVSDTGVALAHPDLAGRIWSNPAEIAGNGLDDDSNGFVDDVHGWDFADGDAVADDANGHGTHVAGIIGAAGNNALGVAGVNWDVRIMAVRFLDASGSGSNANGVKTILYAADQGAHVLNMSWGGGGESGALRDAIQYAHDRNTLALTAAGNDSQNTDQTPHYPSSYDVGTLLSVASSQAHGKLSGFSNKGQVSVDLAAPGSAILSTYIPDGYRSLSGTSMATPMAAGVAALILAENPGLDVTRLRNALLNAVNVRPSYADVLATEGDLDAALALTQFDQGFGIWPSAMTLGKGTTFTFTAHAASGPVQWSVDKTDLASIDSSTGALSARNVGALTVTAKDSTGAVANTTRLEIVEYSGGGGGCSLPSGASRGEQASAALPFALLLLAGLRRRRRD